MYKHGLEMSTKVSLFKFGHVSLCYTFLVFLATNVVFAQQSNGLCVNRATFFHADDLFLQAPGLFQELHEELRAREAEITPVSSGTAAGPAVSVQSRQADAR